MTEALERILAFSQALDERLASRRVPFAWGTAYLNDDLPRVWDLNFLAVTKPGAPAAELAAEAERLHRAAGHKHRKIDVPDPAAGRLLEPGLVELGWAPEHYLIMVHCRPPDRPADTSVVREISEAELQPVRERGTRAEPWGFDDETVRQLLASHFLLDHATYATRFAAYADGEPVSYCELYTDGRTAQIEDVLTLTEYRNRGLARAVVTRALEEARARAADLVFLFADPDDWPKELYRKLGFDELGLRHRFALTPQSLVKGLLNATGASRVTLRQDVAGDVFFPVTYEALAEGVGSIRGGAGIDLRSQPVVRQLEETGAQVVQDDCATAFDDPAFHRMREAYGGLASQIVTPLIAAGRLVGVLSLHQCGTPRVWTDGERRLATRTAAQLLDLGL